jgi:hypothetical protein
MPAPCRLQVARFICSLAATFLAFAGSPTSAQQPKVLAPHKPVAPKIEKRFPWAKPITRQSAIGGFWLTGPSMRSSLYLRSDLKTDPLTVTPILYLSNGVRYSLPPVTIEPAGTAVIEIGQALEAQGVASYAKLYGYAEIEYQWHSAVFCATIKNVDALNSLVYTSNLQQPPESFPAQPPVAGQSHTLQTLEGLWWKQEPNVSGYVVIGNLASKPISATVNVTGGADSVLNTYHVSIGPHETKMVDLAEIKFATSSTGGIYVIHDGLPHSVAVNAALYDDAAGYSAHLPILPRERDPVPDNWHKTDNPFYSALGLMAGAADPMLSFPAGTVFNPYASVRNISDQPVTVTPTLSWMADGASHTWQSAALTAPPHRTVALDVQGLLASAGLKDFNGSFNLSFETSAAVGDLLLSSGSVDKKNTYVFEVVPRGTGESAAKTLSYWSTANGDDTMFTVWNPADEPQDFIFTLFYSGGHYLYPLHLNARSSFTFNASQLIHNQIPDSEGNVIPLGIREGSAEISGTQGEQQHILVAIDAGIYNVQKAICVYPCPTCSGIDVASMIDSPFGLAVSAQKKQTFYVHYNTGNQYDMSGSSNWNSSAPAVATVTSPGNVTGVAPGSTNIGAYTIYSEPIYVAADCNTTCPSGTFQASAPGNVTPKILLGGSSGTDVTNKSQSVVVGQQIVLYASYGVTANSQSWSIPGTVPTNYVGGFNHALTSGGYTQPTLNQQSTTFYWVTAANSQRVTFTLNYGNNQTAQASVIFNISGPTPLSPSTPYLTTQLGDVAINPGPYLQFGSTTGSNIGINFTASVNQPVGYSPLLKWVNFISADTIILTPTTGTQVTCHMGSGLDNNYPSFSPITATTTNDNPKYGPLPTGYVEVNRSFSSQTFLMWNSGLANAIDVPLGSLTWGFTGDAVLSSGNWNVNLSKTSKFANGFVNSSSYPAWSSRYVNGGVTCP